jgi:hypothetical protein
VTKLLTIVQYPLKRIAETVLIAVLASIEEWRISLRLIMALFFLTLPAEGTRESIAIAVAVGYSITLHLACLTLFFGIIRIIQWFPDTVGEFAKSVTKKIN